MNEFKAMLDAGTITQAQFDRFAALEAENERLKARVAKGNDLRIKVSEKGAVSVYGLGRWPVTLYKSQMLRFIGHAREIMEFMKEHDSELTEKQPGDTKAAA